MAEQIIKDQSVYMGGYDLTGRINSLALDYSADLQDATCLGDSFHKRLAGLKDAAAQVSGLMDIDATDAFQFSALGVNDTPFSFGAKGDSVGDVAYTMLALKGDYKIGGAVGDIAPFDAGAQSSGKLIRGTMLLNSKGTPLTTTTNGTKLQLGAVTATQRMYLAMHVLGAGTGSVTLKIQSDSTNAFTGAQTDRITMTAATGIGAEMKSVAGAITDTWWRVVATISGGAPSFKIVVVAGII
jgi:hypothetical protein